MDLRVLASLPVVAALAACSSTEPPTRAARLEGKSDAAPSASAVAIAAHTQANTARKQKIEAVVQRLVAAKGATVKTVGCPDDAADHFTNKCAVSTSQDEKLEAVCNGDSDEPACKLGAAFVDSHKVVQMIRAELAKKQRRARAGDKTDVSCPEGTLVRQVGDRFYCKATSKKKTIPVDVTVTSLDGAVALAIKS